MLRAVPTASRAAAVVLASLIALPARAALIELEDFDRDLAAHGVEPHYTAEGLAALIELAAAEVAGLKRRAEAADGKERKDLERQADTIADAVDRFTAVKDSSDVAAQAAAFPAVQSLLYSVRSEVRGARTGGMVGVALGVLGNLSLKLPYLAPEERARPLTSAEAQLEAANLADPDTGRTYSAPADLAGLSAEQVSQLDVRRDNHLWHTESELRESKARHGSAWNALQARIEALVSEAIDGRYELDRARRILLLDGIKSSGTSPKVKTEDLHGQEWTLKWGEEVQAEVVANRLYAELGGRLTDLVYANKGGQPDLVLVLQRADAESVESGCESIATFDALQRCLLASKYEFDVSASVVGHAVISEDTFKQEPFAAARNEQQELIGRHFVIFNESAVEFEPAGAQYLRLGAGPMSTGAALDDRVKRGLAVFNYWIHNKDAKDSNNKGVVDRQSSTYVEYMHDLGGSLGTLKASGIPNLLKVGDAFVLRRGDTIRFGANMLYLPRAFERATYADAVWMARKVAELPREAILSAVAATEWPDFQQHTMASRLIARRNAIARVFDVGSAMTYDVAPTVVSLRTPADRRDAVRRYRLAIATDGDEGQAVELLEQFMRESGIDIDGGQANWEDEVGSWIEGSAGATADPVLETSDCRSSVIVAFLERWIHPAGLSRRIHRGADDRPLRQCHPAPKRTR